MGYMHRDVTPKNLLILALTPIPTAKVCDFGMVTTETRSKDSFIGPPFSLAPEVPGNVNGTAPEGGGRGGLDGRGMYDRRIDVWSLAYARFRALKSSLPAVRVDRAVSREMKGFLEEWGAVSTHQGDLARLMIRMLAWDPYSRPSAEDALKSAVMVWVEKE